MFVIMKIDAATGESNGMFHRSGEYCSATFETLRGAKMVATKLKKNGMNCVALSYSEFNRLFNPMVVVKSLMSGQDVEIRKSDVGGCCDPSTEQYWSM